MDHEHDTSNELPTLMSLLRDLSLRQRLGLAAAATIVLIGLAWKIAFRADGHLVPLPGSETLDAQAGLELQQRLRTEGLSDFRSSGGRLLVPRAELERYAAVLTASPTTGGDTWAGEWERQNERLTPFSSNRAREANREIARAKLITEMLQKLPDVQQADVVWDEDEQRGWGQTPRARATVYLMPRTGSVLTLEVIRSVRLAVAGSKKNLDPADVVVMDLARQVTYDGNLPVTIGEDLLPALQSVAELCRREIALQVAGLSDADVEVRVDLPRFFAFLAEHPHEARQQLSAAAPGLLRVRIGVPMTSGLEGDDTTRQALQRQISSLTGIGAGAAAEDPRIEVQFEQPPRTDARSAARTFSLATWSLPEPGPTRWLAGGAVLLVGSLLLLNPFRGRRRPSSEDVPPVFRDVAATARDRAARHLHDLEDLSQLNPAALRAIYAHATPRRWAVALRGSSIAVREHLAAALEATDASELRQECEQVGPVTIADIEASRRRILESARSTPGESMFPIG